MIRHFIYRLLKRRQFWRYAGFDEISQLYTSSMLRNMGLSLIGIFVPIYLYKLGYSIPDVLLYLATVAAGRAVGNLITGFVIALKGPKHTILYSCFFQVVALLQLLSLELIHWPLWTVGAMTGLAASLYYLAYHVNLSKILHVDHGGKELGLISIIERIGGVAGPVAGGAMATFLGPDYTICVAIGLVLCSAVPLFLSEETTRINQKLNFRLFAYKHLWRDFISWAGCAVENNVSLTLWPLFMAVTIFTTNSYASVGLVISIGTVAAIVSAHVIGRLIDRRKGALLLNWSAAANALLHCVRPFVTGFGGVVVTNVYNETVTTGYRLPYMRGMYDRADNVPGYRIVYLVAIECVGDIFKLAAWLVIWALMVATEPVTGMKLGFVVAAIASLLIMLQRYPALRPKKASAGALEPN